MPITVQASPPLVAISGNPIRFKLSTDNNLETAGSVIQATLTFTAKGVADDTLTIAWGSQTIVFTVKANPDSSGEQIPDAPPALPDWVTAIAVAIGLNFYIDRDFVLTSAGNDLIFTAREKGSDYSITADKTGAMAFNFAETGGDDQVARTFFKIGLQVLIKSGATFTKIAEDIMPVNANSESLFDIRRTFADQLESDFAFPESSDQLMILRGNMCREYRVRYYEQFGSDITPQKLTESASFFALKAGISHLQEAIYNRQNSSYWDKIGYNQFFLTWQPLTKFIDRYQPEKLYFLVRSTTLMASIKLRIKIYYLGGTDNTVLKGTVANPQNKGVYEICCSLNVLQLPGYDADQIEKYDVWIDNHADERVSEIRTFVMDYENHEIIRYFLFRNSLGGFDTLRTTGIGMDGAEYERTDISKVLGEGFTEKDHQDATGSALEVKTFTVNTGWKTDEDIEWMRDFLLSKQVYQVTGRKLVPIVTTTTKAAIHKDKEGLFDLDFAYRRAYRNEHYSKQIPYAEFTDDFNDDFAQAR